MGSNSEIEGSLDLILAEFDQKLVEVNRDIKRIRYENEKIKKSINQVGGKEDSHDIRAGINAQLEVTKKTITFTSDNLQFLLQKATNIPEDRKVKLRGAMREFQGEADKFQELQKESIKRSKEFVIQAKVFAHSKEENNEKESAPLLTQATEEQQVKQLNQEIMYNQALIIEREQGLQEIHTAVQEVNSMFKDIGMLVNEQQFGFDNIATNVELISSRTGGAITELRIAEDYRQRMPIVNCWSLVLMLLVFFIVLGFIISI